MDALFPRAGISVVQILERLGHRVVCPEEIACCGQPAFNSGYWDESRAVAVKVLEHLKDAETVVIVSGSCGAMVKNFYPQLFAEHAAGGTGQTGFGARLGVFRFSGHQTWRDGSRRAVPGQGHVSRRLPRPARTRHQKQPRALLAKVRDLQLVEMSEAETCCGFGGTFAAKFPAISTAMGEVKCASAIETGADYIVSNDLSCLMHQQGLLSRQGSKLKTIHLAEVLAQQ